jgi:hypothetical protein
MWLQASNIGLYLARAQFSQNSYNNQTAVFCMRKCRRQRRAKTRLNAILRYTCKLGRYMHASSTHPTSGKHHSWCWTEEWCRKILPIKWWLSHTVSLKGVSICWNYVASQYRIITDKTAWSTQKYQRHSLQYITLTSGLFINLRS